MKANLWRGRVTAKGHLYLMQFHVLGHSAFPGWKEGSVAGALKKKVKVVCSHTTSSCQSVLTVPSNFFRVARKVGRFPLSVPFCYRGKKVFGGFTFISFKTSPQDSLIPSSMSSVNSLSLLNMAKDLLLHIPHQKEKEKISLFQLLKFVLHIAALTEVPS